MSKRKTYINIKECGDAARNQVRCSDPARQHLYPSGVSKPMPSSDATRKVVPLLRGQSLSGYTFWVETATMHEFGARRSGRFDCLVVHLSCNGNTEFGLTFNRNFGLEVSSIAQKSPAFGVLQVGHRISSINDVDVRHMNGAAGIDLIEDLKHEKSTLEFRISTNAEISQACRF
jgi:hypothetical protein